MAKPNATSIRSFRKADEEQKRSRQQLKRQRELRQIDEKAEIQRAIDEEQKRWKWPPEQTRIAAPAATTTQKRPPNPHKQQKQIKHNNTQTINHK